MAECPSLMCAVAHPTAVRKRVAVDATALISSTAFPEWEVVSTLLRLWRGRRGKAATGKELVDQERERLPHGDADQLAMGPEPMVKTAVEVDGEGVERGHLSTSFPCADRVP